MTAAFQVNAFQPDAFQTLIITGVLNATDQNDSGAFLGTVETQPIVLIDMHDGGKKRRKQHKEEADKAKQRKDEIIALFEHIVEGKPLVAEAIAQPFIKEVQDQKVDLISSIDFDSLIADLTKVQQLYDAYIEMDDEEVLALL